MVILLKGGGRKGAPQHVFDTTDLRGHVRDGQAGDLGHLFLAVAFEVEQNQRAIQLIELADEDAQLPDLGG